MDYTILNQDEEADATPAVEADDSEDATEEVAPAVEADDAEEEEM